MFRSAVLRSATALTRRAATPSRFVAAAPAWRLNAVRGYAAAGLNKAEVEGRIMALLQGFDKVNDPSNVCPLS